MARLLILAASAPLLLIGAAYPDDKSGAYPEAVPVDEAAVTYRPCRPGPGDDRCIQLYERGVRPAYARWQRAHAAGDRRTEVAMGGPEEAPAYASRRRHADGERDHCLEDQGDDGARGM